MMRTSAILWTPSLLFILLLHMTGCSQVENFDEMVLDITSQSIPFSYAKDLQAKAVVFLDARETAEYEVSHIKGAKHIGYDDFSKLNLEGISKTAELVVYCSVGYRSEKIAEKLQDLGYTNVSNLYGGIFAWKNEGYDVINALGPTNKVHAYNEDWGKWLVSGEKVFTK